MKTKLKLLSVLMLLIASAFTASAYDFEVDGIYYNKTSDTEVEVIFGDSYYSGSVTISASITYSGTTYSVTSISDWAFSYCSGLTSVTIPNSVTSIGEDAFRGCSGLTSVTIPNSVTSIGNYAFWYCSGLTSVTIPNSVTEIGNYAFGGCGGLTSVIIGNSVTSIDESVFEGCDNVIKYAYPDHLYEPYFSEYSYGVSYDANNSIIEDGIIYNADKTVLIFALIDLTSVNIPNSVTTIDYYAFEDCTGLTSVTIPNSVTKIGNGAFYNCSGLTSVTIPNSVTSIGDEAFSGCSGLTSVTIGNSLTSIGYNCFPANTKLLYEDGSSAVIDGVLYNKDKTALLRLIDKSLNTLVILKSVKTIGAYAFSNCSGLTSVTIPNSVTEIGAYAFSNCSGLTSVTIPNSVTTIGKYAFEDCSGLIKSAYPNHLSNPFSYGICISYDAKNSIIEDGVIYNADKTTLYFAPCDLTSVTIPNSVTDIGNDVFTKCTSLSKITIADGNSLLSLKQAFADCPLSEVYLGRNLNYSNTSPFGDKKTLKTVIIGDLVTDIGDYVFSGCTGLNSVSIPNSVTSIGSSAFSGCTGLTSVSIPNSVTDIGIRAFFGCTGLTSVTIPNSITDIGVRAFSDCSGLKAVHITDLTAWCKIDFGNSYSNPLYYAHSLFLNDEKVTNLVIPNSITAIKDYAFNGCSDLISVIIPNSVTSVGENAFSGCSGLIKSAYPKHLSNPFNNGFSVSYDANNSIMENGVIYNAAKTTLYFASCDLTSVTIPNSVTTLGANAFSSCSKLKSIIIPNSVTNISEDVFTKCTALSEITIADSNTALSIGKAFDDCPLADVYIGRNLNYSGSSPFSNKTTLKTVTFGNSATSIGSNAFSGCSGLTSANIPNSVTSIGSSAFRSCSGLTSVTIPNSVTEINSSAFFGCSNLTSVHITDVAAWCKIEFGSYDANPLTYAHSLYLNSEKVTDLVIPKLIPAIKDYAFVGCSELTTVNIPNSVTSIGSSAFHDCSGLTSVTIPNSVTSISDGAFNGCNDLTSVQITDLAAWCKIDFESSDANPLTYAHSLYLNGDKINDLVIPDLVTSIGEHTFNSCSDLTSVTISNSVTTIGSSAFNDCSSLATLTIGGNTSQIGDYTFSGCKNLSTIYSYAGTPPTIYEHTFENLTYAKANLYVPKGCVSIYEADPLWYPFYNILEGDYNGVDDVIADEASGEIVGYYNLQGVRSDDPWEGLNIVVYSDGTRRKIRY